MGVRYRANCLTTYIEWAAGREVRPSDPVNFRRSLKVGDLATVVYRSGARSLVKVIRKTPSYLWVGAANDPNPTEWRYSIRTGCQYVSLPVSQKPYIIPANEHERKKYKPNGKTNQSAD